MINVEVVTGNISDSKCAAVIDNTCLPGGEGILAGYAGTDAVIRVEGPVWSVDNKKKGSEFYRAMLAILNEACEKEMEEVDIASVAAGESNSDLFQAATQAMNAVKFHMTGKEFPRLVRFVCSDEEVTNMYKTAYNYWLAIDHDARMEVPHRHDE